MTAVQRDDGSETVALARRLGIAGFARQSAQARQVGAPPAAATPQPGDPDGADILALARAVGLSGFHQTDDTAARHSPQPGAATGDPDGADIVALARAVGLSGFKPVSDNAAAPAKLGDAAFETAPVAVAAPDSGTLAAAVAVLTKAQAAGRATSAKPTVVPSPAMVPAPIAAGHRDKDEKFVAFCLAGASDLKAFQQWEQSNGPFGCGDHGSQKWLEKSVGSGITLRCYALPTDPLALQGLEVNLLGISLDGHRRLSVGIRSIDARQQFKLCGPGTNGLSAAERVSGRPSIISPNGITGLSEIIAA